MPMIKIILFELTRLLLGYASDKGTLRTRLINVLIHSFVR